MAHYTYALFADGGPYRVVVAGAGFRPIDPALSLYPSLLMCGYLIKPVAIWSGATRRPRFNDATNIASESVNNLAVESYSLAKVSAGFPGEQGYTDSPIYSANFKTYSYAGLWTRDGGGAIDGWEPWAPWPHAMYHYPNDVNKNITCADSPAAIRFDTSGDSYSRWIPGFDHTFWQNPADPGTPLHNLYLIRPDLEDYYWLYGNTGPLMFSGGAYNMVPADPISGDPAYPNWTDPRIPTWSGDYNGGPVTGPTWAPPVSRTTVVSASLGTVAGSTGLTVVN